MCAEGQSKALALVHGPTHQLLPLLTANGVRGVTHLYLLRTANLEVLHTGQPRLLKGFKVGRNALAGHQPVHPLPDDDGLMFVTRIQEVVLQVRIALSLCRSSCTKEQKKCKK